jgi:integrase
MGSIYRRGRTYWVKYYRAGEPLRESSHSIRKGDAAKLLRIREGHLAEGRPFSRTALHLRFEELAEDLRNDYRIRGLRSLQRAEESLAHLVIEFSGWPARDISTDALRAYIARRQGEGAANGTINRELSALRRAFNLAVAAGKLWHCPHIPMLREDNTRRGFFEPEMLEKVRAELPDYLYPVATFAYYTGWRKGEILSLRWDQVDLTRGEVRLDPGTTKNREARSIFLEGELREILETLRQCRAPSCGFVFQHNGGPIRGFKRAWLSACRRAGDPGLLFHDLRRTAVRNMVRAGIPERVAMQVSGHKTRAIFDRYHIVSESDLREAAWKLAAWSGAVQVEAASGGHNLGTIQPVRQPVAVRSPKEPAFSSRG